MSKIKDWMLGVLAKKYALGWLVTGYRKATGYKTGVAVALCGLVFVAQIFGFIPEQMADELYKILGAVGSVTFIEKLKRYQKVGENLANAVKEEAQK